MGFTTCVIYHRMAIKGRKNSEDFTTEGAQKALENE
jgi:hypothetical protein